MVAAAEAAASTQAHPTTADSELVVAVVVTGGPDGDVCYHVRLGPEGVAVAAGDPVAVDATLRISTDHATAAEIAAGSLSAQAAFTTGRLRLGGDLRALAAAVPIVEAVGDVFDEIRPRPPQSAAPTEQDPPVA